MQTLKRIGLLVGLVSLLVSVAVAVPREVAFDGPSADGSDAKGLLDCSGAVMAGCAGFYSGDTTDAPHNAVQYTFVDYPYYAYLYGGEVVYELDLTAGTILQVDFTLGDPETTLYVLLLGSCDENDGLAFGGVDGFQYTVATTGTYYVVVEGYYSDGPYTLAIDCFEPEPPPANDTCLDGECLPPAVDGVFTGDLMWANADYDSYCVGTGGSHDAHDVVYELALQEGGSFTATVTPDDPATDITLFVVGLCGEPGVYAHCIAGVDNGFPGESETISFDYVGYEGEDTLYFLIVKEFNADAGGGFTGVYSHDGLPCDNPISSEDTSWGSLKVLYR